MTTNLRTTTGLILLAMVCAGLVGVPAAVSSQGGQPPSASGTGQFREIVTTFGASLHTDKDGKPFVTGVAQEHNSTLGTKITIDVNCLRVLGNQAFMSGPVVSTHLIRVDLGTDMVFAVADNSEPNDPKTPDQFTNFVFGTCDKAAFKGFLNSERGNIQVRGGAGGVCPIGYRECCDQGCIPIEEACPIECPSPKPTE